ncbi:MAG: D-aminoacyl-tRNA deacylase [Phycisphaerae bacterium]
MRAVIQRVTRAELEVSGAVLSSIERGLLVYVAVGVDEPADAAEKLAEKVVNLRIFDDEAGKLNLSVRDVRGGVLAVPNFTLMADASKGRRPAFAAAAPAKLAEARYDAFTEALRRYEIPVAGGSFGSHMIIRSDADGPVNILVAIPPIGGSE